MTSIGQKIKFYRERSKKSQMELEVEIDASTGSISRMEHGSVNPTKETLVKIVDCLNLNKYEAMNLFGFEFKELPQIVRLTKEITSTLELEDVLQKSVDTIVFELNLYSGFICLIKGDKLFAETSAEVPSKKISLEIIGKALKSLNVDLNDKTNLMARSAKENIVLEGKQLIDYLVPAIPLFIGNLLQKLTNIQSCISLPISFSGEVLGSIMFAKLTNDGFSKEREILDVYCEMVGIAIHNAKEFQKLKNKNE